MSGKSISRYIIFSKSPYFIDIHCQQPLHKAFRYMISSKFQIAIYLVIYFRLPGNKKWPPRLRIFIRLHDGHSFYFIYPCFHEPARSWFYKAAALLTTRLLAIQPQSSSFSSSIQIWTTASLGIRRSPRGETAMEPTFGPSGRQLRLNCCEKKRQ